MKFSIIIAAILAASTATASDLRRDPGPNTAGGAFNEGLINGLGGSTNDHSYTRGYDHGHSSGYSHGQNEGFLQGYGVVTGQTPGPVIVTSPYAGGGGYPFDNFSVQMK
ncbi:hypothetical protein [Tateyamaria sp.]|uniref:hypothetical protein n=1 Tax=Tateyamaria sp. TaxID=1929288 RepID=UPI00329CB4C4